MNLLLAFWLAVLAGVIAGAAVIRLRKAAYHDEYSVVQAALLGGLGAAVIFGVVVVFNAVLYFLLGPTSPTSMLEFTIFTIILFALALLTF